jgi:4-amino-4-deoxy-L-arabinose transferase-like glycosyltransferase
MRFAVFCGGSAPAGWGGAAEVQRALGRFVIRHYPLCFGLVLAIMACNVFLGLATSRIDDSDEARYGVSAFEMLRSKSFLVTTYAHRPEYWNLKPPLGYWLIAGSYRLFGCSAFSMRLPSALFALAVVAATMGFCKRWCSRRHAIVSGLIMATSFGFLSHHGARSGDLDACLTFTLLLMAIQLPRLGDSPLRVLTLGPILGCGFLLKSFAILPMIAVGAAYGLATGSWRKQRLGPCLLSLGALLLVVATWAGARSHADRSFYFVRRMVLEDLFARSTSVIDKGTSSPLSYLAALGDRFAPWPLLIAAAALWVWRERRRELAGGPGRRSWPWPRRRGVLPLLGLWIGIPLTLFSLARTQHHWYLDPIYPACAMLAAPAILYLAGCVPRRLQAAALVVLVALPLAFCEARVLKRVLVRDRMPESQRFLYALRRVSHGRCRELTATFALSHSERFILEVVDGFHVVEDRAGRWPPLPAAAWRDGAASGGTCVLVTRSPPFFSAASRRALGAVEAGSAAPGWVLQRRGATYALFASADAASEGLAAPASGAFAGSPRWESEQSRPRGPAGRSPRDGG